SESIERAFLGRITGFEAELALERLRGRGIVEARRKSWGESVHALAPGLLADWQRYFIPALADGVLVPTESVDRNYEPHPDFRKLLFFFLAETVYGGGIALTKKGGFQKKDTQRAAARLNVAEAALDGFDITCSHQDSLGKPLAVLYDASLRLGLVYPGQGRVEPAADRIRSWLSLPSRDANAQLLSLWWDVYTPADIWLQHGAAAVRNIPRGQWFSVRRLAQALIEAGVTTSGRCDAEAEQSLFSYWLKPMAAFGLMELGM